MKYIKPYHIFESNDTPTSQRLFVDLVLEHCKDFSWSDNPIYRSVKLNEKYYRMTPEPHDKYYLHDGVKLRKSAYLSHNYYTLLMNHLPSWQDYPKRQVICGNYDKSYAKCYRVIPFDKTKLGVVSTYDIQDNFRCPFFDKYTNPYHITDISELNGWYRNRNIDDFDWKYFVKDLEEKSKQNPEIDLLNIEKMNKEFTPENLNMKCISYNQYKNDKKYLSVNDPETEHELWFDNDYMLIDDLIVQNILQKEHFDEDYSLLNEIPYYFFYNFSINIYYSLKNKI